MVYIAILLSEYERSVDNIQVADSKGNFVFSTESAVQKAVERDMKEYAKAEKDAGFKVKIVGQHLEWEDECMDRTARWYIYRISPEDAVPRKKEKK